MGLFSPSFTKPGKGIEKDAPQKRSFFLFFDIFFRKFWHLIRLNLLYTLTMLPTFIIVFLLAGLVSETILSTEGVRSLLETMASLGADYLGDPEAYTYEYSRLIVTFDLFFRFAVSFSFVIFWGMGPTTSGFTFVLRNFSREQHAWIWSDFKDAVKNNFKQSLVVFVLDVLAFVVFFTAFLVYGQMPGIIGALRYVILVLLLVYTLMHQYIYPLLITFDLKLKDLYRNALLFALGKLPSNFLVFLILVAVHFGGLFLCIQLGGGYAVALLGLVLVLECFILMSFSGLLINFNVYPKMKKYMLENSESKVKINNEN